MQIGESSFEDRSFMNKRARVIRFHKTGGPEVLNVQEITLAEPRGKEVLMRVLAIGLSRVDALWRGQQENSVMLSYTAISERWTRRHHCRLAPASYEV
jgi:hypothetical protein